MPLNTCLRNVISARKLFAVNENPLLYRLESLFARLGGRLAKDELSLQTPIHRDLPMVLNLLIDDGVIMLEVAPEAFCFESGPYYGKTCD